MLAWLNRALAAIEELHQSRTALRQRLLFFFFNEQRGATRFQFAKQAPEEVCDEGSEYECCSDSVTVATGGFSHFKANPDSSKSPLQSQIKWAYGDFTLSRTREATWLHSGASAGFQAGGALFPSVYSVNQLKYSIWQQQIATCYKCINAVFLKEIREVFHALMWPEYLWKVTEDFIDEAPMRSLERNGPKLSPSALKSRTASLLHGVLKPKSCCDYIINTQFIFKCSDDTVWHFMLYLFYCNVTMCLLAVVCWEEFLGTLYILFFFVYCIFLSAILCAFLKTKG